MQHNISDYSSVELKKRMIFGIFMLLIIYLVAIVVYAKIEHWTLIESVYFATATMTTVGYGDLHPTTDESRLFTVVFLWCSVGIAIYFLYSVVGPAISMLEHRVGKREVKKFL